MSTYIHSMSLEDALAEYDKIDGGGTDISGIRVLCQNDLFYLLVKACKRHDMLHPWIYDRCREVEENPDGYLDLWSREHFKSSIITFGKTIQDILCNQEITVGIFSENYTLAQKFLQQIKLEFENNETLKTAFPDILYQNPYRESSCWNGDAIVVKRKGNPKEPTVECQGLLSMKVGAHYQLMVYDDVITLNSVSSPEMVAKINSFFEVSLSQSKEGGVKRFIGTRYSYADTYQMILERDIAEPRIYPATDDGTPDGEPVMFSKEYWNLKKRENNTFNLACQYLQNPQAGGNKMFDIQNIVVYDVRPYKLTVVILCDPAKSMKKGAANTAILAIGIDASKRKFLLDGMIHKMGLIERWENLKTLYHKWKNDPGVGSIHVGYETYGSGEVDIDYFFDQMKKEGIQKFPIIPLTKSLNGSSRKADRIERIQPDLNSGYICFPYPTDMNKLTKRQQAAVNDNRIHCLSKSIKRTNEIRMGYDVSETVIKELDNYPYGKLVDGIDCFSRIYDIEIAIPTPKRRGFALPTDQLI